MYDLVFLAFHYRALSSPEAFISFIGLDNADEGSYSYISSNHT